MKNVTSDTDGSTNFTRDVGMTRRMLRHDRVSEHKQQFPDISKAANMAEQLEILEKYVAKAPVIDTALRNSIRSAIATGSYIIDPPSIASKMLKFEEDLYK